MRAKRECAREREREDGKAHHCCPSVNAVSSSGSGRQGERESARSCLVLSCLTRGVAASHSIPFHSIENHRFVPELGIAILTKEKKGRGGGTFPLHDWMCPALLFSSSPSITINHHRQKVKGGGFEDHAWISLCFALLRKGGEGDK